MTWVIPNFLGLTSVAYNPLRLSQGHVFNREVALEVNLLPSYLPSVGLVGVFYAWN